jgi:hypothetical protein
MHNVRIVELIQQGYCFNVNMPFLRIYFRRNIRRNTYIRINKIWPIKIQKIFCRDFSALFPMQGEYLQDGTLSQYEYVHQCYKYDRYVNVWVR